MAIESGKHSGKIKRYKARQFMDVHLIRLVEFHIRQNQIRAKQLKCVNTERELQKQIIASC